MVWAKLACRSPVQRLKSEVANIGRILILFSMNQLSATAENLPITAVSGAWLALTQTNGNSASHTWGGATRNNGGLASFWQCRRGKRKCRARHRHISARAAKYRCGKLRSGKGCEQNGSAGKTE
jgi:hypothetical protein